MQDSQETKQGHAPVRPSAFMSRLARDSRGSTLAMMAAGLIPLTMMIGSGIEMSRAYMTKTRLQSACDAASLAGRRVMSADTLTEAVKDEAKKFFNFNFQTGLYGTDPITPVVTRPKAGTVKVTAATKLPSAIMYVFGFTGFNLAVECEASQNFVNTDIMLVLDVTGSMGCSPADSVSNCSSYAGSSTYQIDGVSYVTEKADSRMKALREAVVALYKELEPIQTQLEAGGMRLRYGVVPYSSGVNVGKLLSANHLVNDQWHYNSRRPVFVTSTTETFANQTSSECSGRGQARTPAAGFPATEKKTTRASGNATRRDCYVTTNNYSLESGQQFHSWLYGEIDWDVSAYVTGAEVPTPSRHPFDEVNKKSKWTGCIEERETSTSITSSSGYAIPSGAKDLDIDLVPTSDEATKWRPYWPDVVYRPDNKNHPQVACPAPAKKLQKWTEADLTTYIDDLLPTGGTYHDNGIIWGARLISAAGIFGAENPDTFNGMPVTKHIIFMTDGLIDTGDTIYSTYGMERWDERVTGGWTSDADQTGRHEQRFRMMCNATKAKNVSIWVVAFSSAVSPIMSECASNSNQVSTSSNKQQLIDRFKEIGKNIGTLRLTQ